MPRKLDDKERYFIYGLRDPRTAEIRYVGQSSIGMTRPLMHSHASALQSNGNLYMVRWIRKIVAPEIVVLERFSFVNEDAATIRRAIDESEIRWIALGRQALGKRLVNLTAGGGGMHGHRFSEASREKMRASGKALAQTPERRAQILAGLEKAHTPEAQAKSAASSRAFYSTDAGKVVRKRLSDLQAARAQSPAGRLHLSVMVEAAKSPDARSKQSESMKRRAQTAEGKAQLERLWSSQRTDIAKQKATDALRLHWSSDDGKRRAAVTAATMREVMSRSWSDPNGRAKWLEALKRAADTRRRRSVSNHNNVLQAWRLELGLSKHAAARLLHIRTAELRRLEAQG